MSNPIFEHLRFFHDLGVKEVYLSEKTLEEKSDRIREDLSARLPNAKTTTDVTPRANPLTVLTQIETELIGCTRCPLHQDRNTIVFGSGNPQAKVVFVGEGPGAEEDNQGLPFVGRAGQLLTQMINKTAQREGIKISRADVYICNVVKCRPPNNRTPEPEEMKTCGSFLEQQLEAIQPKAICLLGGTAAKFVLKTNTGITKLRGKWQKWQDIPVMPTYHPSFLLRPYAQDRKREAWLDLRSLLHFVFD
ncbi:MAG: uracil-DNA glycosylase [Solibacterales bacterium]|nr:uracil-DNA glycosylase [Bryobacterales bacterium]|tara:strand:- start:7231 stop:7974 length:744 start_codon:yes stop_codon:yes gene_type:complete